VDSFSVHTELVCVCYSYPTECAVVACVKFCVLVLNLRILKYNVMAVRLFKLKMKLAYKFRVEIEVEILFTGKRFT